MMRSPGSFPGGVIWYLAGGAPAPVAAYQSIGAASLAASYVNLANPGTFDAAPGVAPTHSGAAGWAFNGTDQYLDIGSPITGTGARTVVVRYTPTITTQRTIVSLSASTSSDLSDFALTPEIAVRISGGNRVWGTGTTDNTVLAIVGPSGGSTSNLLAYKGGILLTPASTANAAYNTGSAGGVIAKSTFATGFFFSGSIQALAIYSSTLTATQVAAVSAAMAAL